MLALNLSAAKWLICSGERQRCKPCRESITGHVVMIRSGVIAPYATASSAGCANDR